jgi:2-oxoglutarate ferredoxin oxidoreductase subunit alpha
MRIRAFPFAASVRAFIEAHTRCYVVEQNRDGQLRTLLAIETGLARDSMTSILDYGGMPLTADRVVKGVHGTSHPDGREAAGGPARMPRLSQRPVGTT